MATPTQPRTFEAGEPGKPVLHELVDKLGDLEAIDPVADPVAKSVRDAIKPGPVKDLLSGVPLGHALHPALTDLAVGSFFSSNLLDLVGGRGSERAADRLIATGLASTPIIVATGMSDWADTGAAARRIGFVHAVTNATTSVLYAASYVARRRGRRGLGKLLSLAGAGTLSVGAHLGGHLSYAHGIGVDQTIFDHPPTDWTPTELRENDLVDGEIKLADVGGVAVMVVRRAGEIHALADRCTHRSAPLHEGTLVDGCIECPWHGSRFRLEDGSVERGPATGPEPAYHVRVSEGRIELKVKQ